MEDTSPTLELYYPSPVMGLIVIDQGEMYYSDQVFAGSICYGYQFAFRIGFSLAPINSLNSTDWNLRSVGSDLAVVDHYIEE